MHWSSRLRTTLRLWLECTLLFVIGRMLGPVAADLLAEYWRLIRVVRKKHPAGTQ